MSRGCPVGCGYCPYTSFYGNKIEFRSIDTIINDIKKLLSIGIKTIQFRDQYFSIDKEKVYELCNRILKEGLKIKWRCETRLESLDIDLIDIMVKTGLDFICFGIESANTKEIKNFGRPTLNVDRVKKLVSYLNSKNVTTFAFYIIGFPDDSWETIRATYDLSIEIKSAFSKYSIYMPMLSDKEFIKRNEIKEITPDIFIPFDNILNVNTCNKFNIRQLKTMVDQLAKMPQCNANVKESELLFKMIHEQVDTHDILEKVKT